MFHVHTVSLRTVRSNPNIPIVASADARAGRPKTRTLSTAEREGMFKTRQTQ
jgi:hypothetical protein